MATCLFGEGLFYIWYFVFIDIVDPVNMQLKDSASRTAMMISKWNTKISPTHILTECPICLRHMLLPRESVPSSVAPRHNSVRGINRSSHHDLEMGSSLHNMNFHRSPGPPITRNSVLVHISKDRALSVMSCGNEIDENYVPNVGSHEQGTGNGPPRKLSVFTTSPNPVVVATTRLHEEGAASSKSPRNRKHMSTTINTHSSTENNNPNQRHSAIISPGTPLSHMHDGNQIHSPDQYHVQNRSQPSSMIFRIDSCEKPQRNSFHVLSESTSSKDKGYSSPIAHMPAQDALLLVPASPHTPSLHGSPRRNQSIQATYSEVTGRRASQKLYRETHLANSGSNQNTANANTLSGMAGSSQDQRRCSSKLTLPAALVEEFADLSAKITSDNTARQCTNSTRSDSFERKMSDRAFIAAVDGSVQEMRNNTDKTIPHVGPLADGQNNHKSRAASIYPGDYILAQVPCGHIFHKACIVEWGMRENTCPVCRADLGGDDHELQLIAEGEEGNELNH